MLLSGQEPLKFIWLWFIYQFLAILALIFSVSIFFQLGRREDNKSSENISLNLLAIKKYQIIIILLVMISFVSFFNKGTSVLVWEDEVADINWQTAKVICEGHGSRLPTLTELLNELSEQFIDEQKDYGGFRKGITYWTSYEDSDADGGGIGCGGYQNNFNSGKYEVVNAYCNRLIGSESVRCVH